MSDNEHTSQSLKLVCPHCGGKLGIEMEAQGSGYMTYDAPSGFACTTRDCGAEWDVEGEPVQEPNWVLWPSIYTKPEKRES
jgi:hypothetical protein